MTDDKDKNKKLEEYPELTFCAVYGEKKGDFWPTKMHQVSNQFQEQMLSENGKIDLSVLFENVNIEENPLYQATEGVTNVFYLYDTQMVLHFINKYEEKEEYSNVSVGLMSNCEYYVHRIIKTKWFAYLITLWIDKIHRLHYLWDSWYTSWYDCIWGMIQNYPEYRGRFPSNPPYPPYPLYLSQSELLSIINNWKNDLIVRLLSLDPQAVDDAKELKLLHCDSCFKNIPEDLTLYEIWTEIDKTKILEQKCVAMTIHPLQYKEKIKQIRYAISGIDDQNDKKDIIEVCVEITKIIAEKLNLNKDQIVRCSLKDNNVLYIPKDNPKDKTDYQTFKVKFDKNKDSICNKCSLKKDGSCKAKKKMGSCKRMFSCSERKLFNAIGDSEKAVVFTSFQTCDLCLTVQQNKYRNITLAYPELRYDFDPIAKTINSL